MSNLTVKSSLHHSRLPFSSRRAETRVEEEAFSELLTGQLRSQGEGKGRQQQWQQRFSHLNRIQKELVEHPNLQVFSQYKDEVRTLAREIMNQAVKLHRFEDKRKREFEVIKVVDDKLMTLWHQVTSPGNEVNAALRTMGEIRGILLEELR